MANPFTQYLRDTRGELRHVAWPTQMQTIVYTLLVAGISIGVAIYLGFFDFVFTGALGHFLDFVPQAAAPSAQTAPAVQTSPITVTQAPAPATSASASSPATK